MALFSGVLRPAEKGFHCVMSREGLLRKYAPVLGLLSILVFLFVYDTLPTLKTNQNLNRIRQERLQEIEAIQKAEKKFLRLQEALNNDPITIENRLRRSFKGAKREGELEIDPKAP
jgi:hypothetical protein